MAANVKNPAAIIFIFIIFSQEKDFHPKPLRYSTRFFALTNPFPSWF